MPRRDISFPTTDHLTLRGWLFTPEPPSASPSASASPSKLPCLVMSHGWTALKEHHLDTVATFFTTRLPLACLVYDNRGFGASDHKPGQPRHEIVPELQRSDYSDAITYAQSLPEVDAARIGIWGSSYSGGHALFVGAVDRRVRAVLSQVPLADGWQNFHRLIRPDLIAGMDALFLQDRLARLEGKEALTIPVVSSDPSQPSSLPTADSYAFFAAWEKKSDWKNQVTVRSLELLRANDPSHMIHRISPTPLFMSVAENDCVCPTDIALEAYARAREPKRLVMLPGGHFDAYEGLVFGVNAEAQVKFLRETLCKGVVGAEVELPMR